MRRLGKLEPSQRPVFGKTVNEVAQEVEKVLEASRSQLKQAEREKALQAPNFDPTLPGIKTETGALHPLTLIDWRLDEIRFVMGFYVLDYPEVDSEYFLNFEGLNIPADHPARDMQDTFGLQMESY